MRMLMGFVFTVATAVMIFGLGVAVTDHPAQANSVAPLDYGMTIEPTRWSMGAGDQFQMDGLSAVGVAYARARDVPSCTVHATGSPDGTNVQSRGLARGDSLRAQGYRCDQTATAPCCNPNCKVHHPPIVREELSP